MSRLKLYRLVSVLVLLTLVILIPAHAEAGAPSIRIETTPYLPGGRVAVYFHVPRGKSFDLTVTHERCRLGVALGTQDEVIPGGQGMGTWCEYAYMPFLLTDLAGCSDYFLNRRNQTVSIWWFRTPPNSRQQSRTATLGLMFDTTSLPGINAIKIQGTIDGKKVTQYVTFQ